MLRNQSTSQPSFSSEMMRWSTQTLVSSMMPHQSSTKTTTPSFCLRTCSAPTELMRTLVIWMTSTSSTTRCTPCSVTCLMLHWLTPNTLPTLTAVCSVTTSSEMKSSPDKWTTVVFAFQPSTVTTSMMLSALEQEISCTMKCLTTNHQLESTLRLARTCLLSVEDYQEVRSLRELLISITTILNICAITGSMMPSPHSPTGDPLSLCLHVDLTNTTRSTQCRLFPTPIIPSSRDHTLVMWWKGSASYTVWIINLRYILHTQWIYLLIFKPLVLRIFSSNFKSWDFEIFISW